MKKIYLGVFAVAMAFGANAQKNVQLTDKHAGNPRVGYTHATPASNMEKIQIWSDNFSNPSTWTMANTSQPISWDWVITTNQGDIPNAAPSLQPFASSTASNGFALINSDGQPGNVDGDGAIQATIRTATPIDLTGYPNVILKFQHSYRWYYDTRGVRVSGNNGLSWTDFDVTDVTGYPNAQNSENPVYETINISSIAGGSNQVLIEFYYDDNDYWAWYWVVDDVEILSQPDNDLQTQAAWISGVNNGGVEYGRNPVDQVDADWFVGTLVQNFGVATQTNVATADVYNGFSSNGSVASLASDSSVIIEQTETLTLTPGTYTGVHTAVSDLETAASPTFGDNALTREFEVTAATSGASLTQYSVDGIGVYTQNPVISSLGTNSFTTNVPGSEDGMIFVALYNIKQSASPVGIRVMLSSGTVAGGNIYGGIMDTAIFWSATMSPLYSTDGSAAATTVTAADITAGYKDLYFVNPPTLAPGPYYASVELYSNGNANDIRVADDETVAQPGDASAIYLPFDPNNQGVYGNGTAFGIRLLFGGAGVGENSLEGVSIYPNPSQGIVNVTNGSNSVNTITVHDINGRVVLTKTASQATTLDLSTAGAGVYTVTVSNENGSVVERVIIK